MGDLLAHIAAEYDALAARGCARGEGAPIGTEVAIWTPARVELLQQHVARARGGGVAGGQPQRAAAGEQQPQRTAVGEQQSQCAAASKQPQRAATSPQLFPVGFWCAPGEVPSAERPDPRALAAADAGRSALPPREAALVLRYLTAGALVESWEHGHSRCRFACAAAAAQPRLMGCATLTDGAWVWPEGYAHYVAHHAVPLPPELRKRILAAAPHDAHPAAALPGRNHLLFRPDGAPPEPLPQGTREWLRTHSNLVFEQK